MHRAIPPTRLPVLLLAAAMALAATGFAAVWALVALALHGPVLWMMPLAAIDVAAVLILLGEPAGRRRVVLATAGCTLAYTLGLWLVNAVQLGRQFGIEPLAALGRLGPSLAWDLSLATIGLAGSLLGAGSVIAAGVWAGFGAGLSARRRSP